MANSEIRKILNQDFDYLTLKVFYKLFIRTNESII